MKFKLWFLALLIGMIGTVGYSTNTLDHKEKTVFKPPTEIISQAVQYSSVESYQMQPGNTYQGIGYIDNTHLKGKTYINLPSNRSQIAKVTELFRTARDGYIRWCPRE